MSMPVSTRSAAAWAVRRNKASVVARSKLPAVSIKKSAAHGYVRGAFISPRVSTPNRTLGGGRADRRGRSRVPAAVHDAARAHDRGSNSNVIVAVPVVAAIPVAVAVPADHDRRTPVRRRRKRRINGRRRDIHRRRNAEIHADMHIRGLRRTARRTPTNTNAPARNRPERLLFIRNAPRIRAY